VIATLAEEMPANEARDLGATLNKQIGLKTAHLLINQVYPDRFPAGSPQAAVLDRLVAAPPADDDLAALTAHSALAHDRRRLNERYIEQLARNVPAPQSIIPLLFVPALGLREIQALSQLVEQAFTAA
jgi:hypothetical protein